jgi:hypothetical protein
VDRNWKGWTRRSNKREIQEESEWEQVDQRKHRKRGSEEEPEGDQRKKKPRIE